MNAYTYTATLPEPSQMPRDFKDDVRAAVRRAADCLDEPVFFEKEGKPVVSFTIAAVGEQAALTLGEDVMRSVLAGDVAIKQTASLAPRATSDSVSGATGSD
jgi:hypothetical protein